MTYDDFGFCEESCFEISSLAKKISISTVAEGKSNLSRIFRAQDNKFCILTESDDRSLIF